MKKLVAVSLREVTLTFLIQSSGSPDFRDCKEETEIQEELVLDRKCQSEEVMALTLITEIVTADKVR